jgi:hypothetical protein
MSKGYWSFILDAMNKQTNPIKCKSSDINRYLEKNIQKIDTL